MTSYRTEHATTEAGSRPLELYSRGAIFTVLGNIHDWRPGWSGSVSATLRLSVGDLPFVAKRDSLPLELGNGSGVRIRMRRRHREEPLVHVMSVASAAPLEPGETSWIPTSLYHRNAAMAQLRRLLSAMEPGLQGIFMAATVDAVVQRRFFWRPCASDHHCYPGGLFDQSVAAARLAHEDAYASERERGLATLACLLFDIGKTFDEQLQPDEPRLASGLQPHAQTAHRLRAPLLRVARLHPELTRDFAYVLGCPDLVSAGSELQELVPLRKQILNTMRQAWTECAPVSAAPSTHTHTHTNANRGAAA